MKRLDSAALQSQFAKCGYLVLPKFFQEEELVDLLSLFDELEEKFRNTVVPESFRLTRYGCGSLGATLNENPVALAMAKHPRLEEVTRAIIGEFRLGSIGSWITKQGYGQGWHQDSFSDEPGQFVLNRLIYGREVTSAGGPLYVVPGSHLTGDIPPGGNQDFLPGETAVTVCSGTVVLMHSRCYHKVAINQSEKPRIQMNTRALPAAAIDDMSYRAIYRTGRWDFRENREW